MKNIRLAVLVLVSCFLWSCTLEVTEEKGLRLPGYEKIAPAESVVFIHGMFMTPLVWTEWEQHFQGLGYQTYAPAWPLHELSVDEQNNLHPSASLAALTLPEVVQHYRDFIQTLDEKPILIGHSMGGLVAQKLLEENLVAAAIVVNSAPPFGVITAEPEFLRSNLPVLNPARRPSAPVKLTPRQFENSFANGTAMPTQQEWYETYIVPESRRVGRASLTRGSRVDTSNPRPPMLIVAGGLDQVVTATLNYNNFKIFAETPAITDFVQFPERNHMTIKQENWESVADYIGNWITENSVEIQ